MRTIQGLKNMREAIVPKIYYEENLSEKIVIEDGRPSRQPARWRKKKGSLSVFRAARQWLPAPGAERMPEGTIVVILPDRSDRYLSVTQFRSICAKCPP